MGVVKGESVWCTNSSRSLDSRPLRAFIMKAICSFIICISTIMCGGVVSTMDGWLVSCWSCLLEALLPSSPSRSLLLALVPLFSSLWLLGPTSLWHSYSSRSWFCLVRCSNAVARVCTYLSRALVRGFSSLLLLVAIEQVSTIQLFVWEMVIWLLLLPFPINDVNWWYQKSSVSYTVLMSSKQDLHDTKRRRGPYEEYRCGTSQIPSECQVRELL